MRKSELEQIIKEEIARYISKVLTEYVVNESIRKIKTTKHNKEWTDKFRSVVKKTPEIIECHRLMGDTDYLLKVMVKDSDSYNDFYSRLTKEIDLSNVSGLQSLEEVKQTSSLPLDYI